MNSPGFFRLAKEASYLSPHPRCKVGAVLVNKKPISVGYNKTKSHTKFANPEIHEKISIHAEMSCLLPVIRKDIRGYDIYVYREDCDGNIANSRPCEQCLDELKKRGIRRIFYTIKFHPFFRFEYV